MTSRWRAALATIAIATSTACSTDRSPNELFDPSDDGVLVLDAALIVDAPFPSVYLSRAVSPDQDFVPGGAAESGASVQIESADGEQVAYAEATGEPGRYHANGPAIVVRPETTYSIRVVTAAGEVVTAATHTPVRFEVSQWLLLDDQGEGVLRELASIEELGESVYQDPRNRIPYTFGLLEARFERPDVPAFQVGISNLETDSELVVDPDFFTEEELADLERFLASPPIGGYDDQLRLPWFAIYFEGRTVIRIFALDENWYDLVRSSPELAGGRGAVAFGGNLGDAFERPIFHVDGGIGLFGSASVDSGAFLVLPEGG